MLVALTELHRSFNGLCVWCGRDTILDAAVSHPHKATREHIVPRHRGGSDSRHNLALSCFRCNNQRGNSDGPPACVEASAWLRTLSASHDQVWGRLLAVQSAQTWVRVNPPVKPKPKETIRAYHSNRVIASVGPDSKPRPVRRRYFNFAEGW